MLFLQHGPVLINEGVSLYRIGDVFRHKIPGMSEVTMMYNRPTIQDLIEAIGVIEELIPSHSSKIRSF